eukprot:13381204-Alexandrium_andersonii.AAC.1
MLAPSPCPPQHEQCTHRPMGLRTSVLPMITAPARGVAGSALRTRKCSLQQPRASESVSVLLPVPAH